MGFASRVMSKADALAQRLEARGANVTNLTENIEGLTQAIEDAKNACRADKKSCIEALKNAKQSFNEFRKGAVKAVVRGKGNDTRNQSGGPGN